MRVELEDLRTSAEKVRCIAWANEPASTLEDSVVELTALRSMIDAAEVEALGAYDASKEWKAAGALSAPARIAEMTCGRAESIRWRRGLARKLRSMPHTVSAFELGDISIDHVGVLCRANLVCLALEFARDEEVLVDKARTLPFDEFVAEVQRWRDIVDPEGAERRALPALLRAAALRFWLSRLRDWHLPREASLLTPKDPSHFERILRERIANPWHPAPGGPSTWP